MTGHHQIPFKENSFLSRAHEMCSLGRLGKANLQVMANLDVCSDDN